LCDVPVRFGLVSTPNQLKIYQTADDGGDDGYPKPNDANTYFAYLCSSLSFPKQIGQQTFTADVGETGEYVFNLGNGYIPEGTYIICRRIGKQLYANINSLNTYFSEDGSETTAELGLEEDDGLPESVIYDDLFNLSPSVPVLAIGFDSDAWIVSEMGDDEEDE
jgi:hypothetical protein